MSQATAKHNSARSPPAGLDWSKLGCQTPGPLTLFNISADASKGVLHLGVATNLHTHCMHPSKHVIMWKHHKAYQPVGQQALWE